MGKNVKKKLTRSNSGKRTSRNTIRRQEEKSLVNNFKLKKKQKKSLLNRTMNQTMKEEEAKEENNKDALKREVDSNGFIDNIKIEMDDVMQDESITSHYPILPGELEIIEPPISSTASNETSIAVSSTTTILEKTSNGDVEGTIEQQNIRLLDGDNGMKCVLLQKNQKIAVKGMASIYCLCGSVEIGGYHLDSSDNSKRHNIYSPETQSLQYINDTCLHRCNAEDTHKLIAKLKERVTDADCVERFMASVEEDGIFSCVVFEKNLQIIPKLLKHLNSFEGFDNEFEVLNATENVSYLKTSRWRDAVDSSTLLSHTDCNCVVMVCGGKDVGKSSFSRYTINRLLKKHASVYYLECDCGQTEFTPPGTLSLVKVSQPLLGPSYTHPIKPVRSFFYGHISPGNKPNEYIWLIDLLFKYYTNDCNQDFPLVVNQQGWVKGLGLSLLMDCIRVMNPCVIVQINSPTHDNRNPPSDFTDAFIESQLGWSVHKDFQSIHGRKHTRSFVKIIGESIAVTNKKKSLLLRELLMTAYFSDLFRGHFTSHQQTGESVDTWSPPLLSTLQPVVVRWSDVALHVVHQKIDDDKMLYAFNLSFVCLCYVPPEFIRSSQGTDALRFLTETPINDDVECVGFGIIRNIDTTNQLFYILTPEPPETLQQVNVLLKGNAQLPLQYLHQDPNNGYHPYVSYENVSTSFKGSGVARPRFNLKRKPSRNKLSFGDANT